MSTLREIAAEMMASMIVTEAYPQSRRLERGLNLRLERVGHLIKLSLSRTTAKPGDLEIALCIQAFHVPSTAQGTMTLTWPVQPDEQLELLEEVHA